MRRMIFPHIYVPKYGLTTLASYNVITEVTEEPIELEDDSGDILTEDAP